MVAAALVVAVVENEVGRRLRLAVVVRRGQVDDDRGVVISSLTRGFPGDKAELDEGDVIRVDTRVLAPGEVVDIFPTEQSREDWEEVQKVLGRR